MTLSIQCEHCQKKVSVEAEQYLEPLKVWIQKYTCGHSVLVHQLEVVADANYHALDGSKKECYEYQVTGVKKVEETNYNCLIADAMGLGKTIQAIVALRNAPPELLPAIIVVKSATIYQWVREFREWGSLDDLGILPIFSKDSPFIPGFKAYLVSMDLINRQDKAGNWIIVDKLLVLNPKFIIVDECHSFKDRDSKRTHALVRLIKNGGIKHKLFLSGTPIKNRAGEYFTVLNLLAPDHFPSWTRFASRWLEANEKGVPTRIRPYALEDFKKLTSRWIIRREKSEVLTNLPEFSRQDEYLDTNHEWLKTSYNRELSLFDNALNSEEGLDGMAILAWLNRLRQITEQAKVNATIEYVEEFLESCDDEKIAIGVHHKAVRDALYYSLEQKGYRPLKLSGEDSSERKDWIQQEFSQPHRRVLVINMLSGGVGLNLQCCAHTLIIARQWSSADEEQYESRFHRNGQEKPVVAKYMHIKGTIDEFFAEMVAEKRQIFNETVSDWEFGSDYKSLKQLSERVLQGRLM